MWPTLRRGSNIFIFYKKLFMYIFSTHFDSLKNITNQKIYFHDNHSYQTRHGG